MLQLSYTILSFLNKKLIWHGKFYPRQTAYKTIKLQRKHIVKEWVIHLYHYVFSASICPALPAPQTSVWNVTATLIQPGTRFKNLNKSLILVFYYKGKTLTIN